MHKLSALTAAVILAFVSQFLMLAHAEGLDLHKDKLRFVTLLIEKQGMRREIFYCWSDLKYFHDENTVYCDASRAIINILAFEANFGRLKSSETETLRDIVNMYVGKMEK